MIGEDILQMKDIYLQNVRTRLGIGSAGWIKDSTLSLNVENELLEKAFLPYGS